MKFEQNTGEIKHNILRYTADKEGIMKLISLSIGKYVVKENVLVERPPTLLTKGGWLLHISLTKTEVQQVEKILQNKPNALNLLCSRIQFSRNKSRTAKAAPQTPGCFPNQLELEKVAEEDRKAEEERKEEEIRKREEYWRAENAKMHRQKQEDQMELIRTRKELGIFEQHLAQPLQIRVTPSY